MYVLVKYILMGMFSPLPGSGTADSEILLLTPLWGETACVCAPDRNYLHIYTNGDDMDATLFTYLCNSENYYSHLLRSLVI